MFEAEAYMEAKNIIRWLYKTKRWHALDPKVKKVYKDELDHWRSRLKRPDNNIENQNNKLDVKLAAPIINLAIIIRTIKAPLTRNLYKTFLYTCAVCVGVASILLYAILSSFELFLMNPQLSGAIMPILLFIPQACIVMPIILVSASKKKAAFSTSTAKIFRILIIGLSVPEIIIVMIGFLSTLA